MSMSAAEEIKKKNRFSLKKILNNFNIRLKRKKNSKKYT